MHTTVHPDEREKARGPGVQTGEWFRTTQWTDLLRAKNKDQSALAHAGLSSVCEKYWPPIYTYLRRAGNSVSEAEDLTQGFFEHLLKQEWLKNVEPGNGKFRSFLLKSLKNFCANVHARALAEKRGGKQLFIRLEDLNREEEQVFRASDSLTPEESFDRRWAESLMARAIERLQQEYVDSGKAQLYEALKETHDGDENRSTYAAIGARLSLSEGAIKTAVHRMRARLANLLRMEIESTVENRDQVQEELCYLRETLSR